ncbi:MAG: SIMPL domain-containing protein [Nanoarchaeota archaeon]
MIVKIKDSNLVGRAVDVVIDDEGLVQNINFEISKETENTLKKEALTKAAQDAREKAEALAEGS